MVLNSVPSPFRLALPHSGMRKRTVALLLLLSLGVATYGSLAVHPYSIASPKRLALNHLHITEEDRGGHGGGGMYGTGGEAVVDAHTMRDMAEAAMMFGGDSAGSAPPVPASAPEVDARTMRDMAEAAMMFGGVSAPASAMPDKTGAPAASSVPGSPSSLSAATCLSGGPPRMRVKSSRFSFSSTDSVPTDFAFGRGDSVSGGERRSRLEPMGRDFTSVFPVSKLLQGGVHMDAGQPPLPDSDAAPLPPPPGSSPPPAAAPAVAQLPYVCRTAEDEVFSSPGDGDDAASQEACGAEATAAGACAAGANVGSGRRRRRMHLQAFTERAAWGILNVTTMGRRQLRAWSFGQILMPSLIDAPGVSAPLITDACCPSGRC